ncbi:hypothetical protein BCY91_05295 [Pelobium manganitolerans]|uniref:WbqC-like protein n=1 Tax=Pelobium manganitolerans TaxID=1842495 RepID=A0A419S613_9SPHI|nr:WbqC family protein [Pelobium manganitolerans]RKD16287.1 hypothetical protein BCY91_05295 [Pelobium manganitolerans]
MENGAVFPLFYLPNVEFFKTLREQNKEQLFIEKQEHYPKQSSRNRTTIAGPNGKLQLTVPVQKGSNTHTAYKDVKISYADDWQRIHWLSLGTSYRSSAYFEFYEDDFRPFYEKKFNYLFDYNLELFHLLLKLLKMPLNFDFTDDYQKTYTDKNDFRESLNWKNQSSYQHKTYYQVFQDKYGYQNNLSVVDLLFSQGPQASRFF